ncbi:hypothetical protein [Glaciimonas soli]|uniref:Uncharacterized protein n=1 Tax=Glaciimonas soli TaxID=2590999 RepID=A0A843YQA4_9BURK|nr:hypothetical protein [Glaciimonas soli]MQR01240.1 hypothetical protein [Glaciimonas soli]
MDVQRESDLIDECINKIQTLAALALYGDNVELAVQVIINEARFYCSTIKTDESRANLLALKNRLNKLANFTHPSLPAYKKTLQFAASAVMIS